MVIKRKVNHVLTVVLITVGLLTTGGCARWTEHIQSKSTSETPASVTTLSAPATQAQLDVAGVLPTQETLSQLYDQVAASVVNIKVTVTPSEVMSSSPFGFPFGNGNLPQAAPQHGEGSGFIYDEQGHIVTNNHVVADADPGSIVVYFANGAWANAEIVARDPQADLAVLKVVAPEGTALQPLKFATPDSLRVGYYVAAVGSPFGLDETLTLGVVSALGRSLPTGETQGTTASYSLPDLIQTDAAINPGNSGGPLLDLKGDVVGVTFAIDSPVRANAGIGFAIPVSVVQKVVPALIKDGVYHYAYVGISGLTIDAQVAEQENLSNTTLGVYVGATAQGGPADQAGIQAGDIVTAIDNKPVRRFEDMISYLFNATEPGQRVTLHIVRNEKEMSLEVKLAERPQEVASQGNESTVRISVADALQIAQRAVSDAGIMNTFDSTSVQQDVVDGQPVWIVTLKGEGQSATVTVDAASGEVLSLESGS